MLRNSFFIESTSSDLQVPRNCTLTFHIHIRIKYRNGIARWINKLHKKNQFVVQRVRLNLLIELDTDYMFNIHMFGKGYFSLCIGLVTKLSYKIKVTGRDWIGENFRIQHMHNYPWGIDELRNFKWRISI